MSVTSLWVSSACLSPFTCFHFCSWCCADYRSTSDKGIFGPFLPVGLCWGCTGGADVPSLEPLWHSIAVTCAGQGSVGLGHLSFPPCWGAEEAPSVFFMFCCFGSWFFFPTVPWDRAKAEQTLLLKEKHFSDKWWHNDGWLSFILCIILVFLENIEYCYCLAIITCFVF